MTETYLQSTHTHIQLSTALQDITVFYYSGWKRIFLLSTGVWKQAFSDFSLSFCQSNHQPLGQLKFETLKAILCSDNQLLALEAIHSSHCTSTLKNLTVPHYHDSLLSWNIFRSQSIRVSGAFCMSQTSMRTKQFLRFTKLLCII